MLAKPLDLRGVPPGDLPEKLRTLLAAIQSRTLAARLRLVAVGALGYFLLVPDLVPDLGPLGLADDLIVARVAVGALVAWNRAGRPDDE